MFSAILLPIVITALSLVVGANPVARVDRSPVTVSLTRRLNLTSAHELVRQDRARAHTFRLNGKSKKSGVQPRDAGSVPVLNQVVTYTATVGIGSPATDYSLIMDTGSSNTWVGADKAYVKTRTSTMTVNTVSVTYGSGEFTGQEYLDTVNVGGGLIIPRQSIGVARSSSGFDGVDGILGLGPTDLTLNTLSPLFIERVPTVTDNLYKDGIIPANEIGIFFQPTLSEQPAPDGEITWGGIDASKMTKDITWIPVTSGAVANMFWGIDQSISYGDSTTILSFTSGIVDTGTTLIMIASDAFERYQQATGATKDDSTGLLRISANQFKNLRSLFFNAGGSTFEFTPNAQIWPRSLNSEIGGTADNLYLIVADIGQNSGAGLDFINGMTFLQRFYSAYDTANKRVGLAPTPFTKAETN